MVQVNITVFMDQDVLRTMMNLLVIVTKFLHLSLPMLAITVNTLQLNFVKVLELESTVSVPTMENAEVKLDSEMSKYELLIAYIPLIR